MYKMLACQLQTQDITRDCDYKTGHNDSIQVTNGNKNTYATLPPKKDGYKIGQAYVRYLFSSDFTLDDYINLERNYPEYFNDDSDYYAVYNLPMGVNTLINKQQVVFDIFNYLLRSKQQSQCNDTHDVDYGCDICNKNHVEMLALNHVKSGLEYCREKKVTFNTDVFSDYFKYVSERGRNDFFNSAVMDTVKCNSYICSTHDVRNYDECVKVFNSIMDRTMVDTSSPNTNSLNANSVTVGLTGVKSSTINDKVVITMQQLYPELMVDVKYMISYGGIWFNDKFYIYLFEKYYSEVTDNDISSALTSFVGHKKDMFLKLVDIIRNRGHSEHLPNLYRRVLRCVVCSDDYNTEFAQALYLVLPRDEVNSALSTYPWFQNNNY